MGAIGWIILGVVTLLSLYNLLMIRSMKKRIEETKDSIQSQVSWAKEELRDDLAGVRTVIKILASGGRVTPDMIEEGKPYQEMSAADAVKLLHESPDTVVLDVRTPDEYMAGHIPGAKLIPIDELETRLGEVPKEAKGILVHCQGGTRSAAACQLLSEKGYTNLINMYDGMGSWPGQREIGVTIRPPASVNRNA